MILRRKLALAGLAVLGAAGFFWLGRLSDGHPARSSDGGYAAGLAAGRAQGVAEGRALQVGLGAQPGDRDAVTKAFQAGYQAGANDVFGGWDGGWGTGEPYIVVLVPGTGGVTYRIGSREPLRPGIAYYLCGTGPVLCRQDR